MIGSEEEPAGYEQVSVSGDVWAFIKSNQNDVLGGAHFFFKKA